MYYRTEKRSFRPLSPIFALLVSALIICGCEKKGPQGAPPESCATPVQSLTEHPSFRLLKKPGSPPNIIFMVVDALRPDHLSCYGYKRKTSAFLDALAEQGAVFDNAFAHSSHTHCSTATILTGTIPPVHGVHRQGGPMFKKVTADKLADFNVTMPELFKNAGYSTGAFLVNWNLVPSAGYGQGFDHFEPDLKSNPAEYLHRTVLGWLENRQDDKPFFIYLHYIDVHHPYHPPEPYKNMYPPEKGLTLQHNGPVDLPVRQIDLDHTIAQYDAQINYLDDRIREFFSELEKKGLLKNTVVVITADHGEEFMDHHGFGHANTLYDEVLRVPLIIWEPGVVPAARRPEMVMHVDLLPTLAALAGASTTGLPLYGVDLFNAASPVKANPASTMRGKRVLYSELFIIRRGIELESIRTCEEKLIIFTTGVEPETREYYDLTVDPAEKNNHYSGMPTHSGELYEVLQSLANTPPGGAGETVELDEKTIKGLKSLGYLQ